MEKQMTKKIITYSILVLTMIVFCVTLFVGCGKKTYDATRYSIRAYAATSYGKVIIPESDGEDASNMFKEGTSVTIRAVPDPGCLFDKWYCSIHDEYIYQSTITITVERDERFAAHFVKADSLAHIGNYTLSVSGATINTEYSSTQIKLTASNEDTFGHWYKGEEKNVALSYKKTLLINKSSITQDVHYTASDSLQGFALHFFKKDSTIPDFTIGSGFMHEYPSTETGVERQVAICCADWHVTNASSKDGITYMVTYENFVAPKFLNVDIEVDTSIYDMCRVVRVDLIQESGSSVFEELRTAHYTDYALSSTFSRDLFCIGNGDTPINISIRAA